MPFQIGSVAVHDDGQHTGSAKRDTASGVAGLNDGGDVIAPGNEVKLTRDANNDIAISENQSGDWAITARRTAANTYTLYNNTAAGGKIIQDSSMKNIASGIAGLDALLGLLAHRTRNGIGGFGNNYTQVAGTWSATSSASQTDWDDILLSAAGFVVSQGNNLDEIKWPSVILNAGTYKIVIAYEKNNGAGILEVLHGTTSIGTQDTYDAGAVFNQVVSFTYSPTARASADFRIRANGKNVASSGYYLDISRIEIFKTA